METYARSFRRDFLVNDLKLPKKAIVNQTVVTNVGLVRMVIFQYEDKFYLSFCVEANGEYWNDEDVVECLEVEPKGKV